MVLIHVSDDTVNGEDILRSAADRARALGVEAQTVHRKGDVAESIVAAAAELRADLLVIGDHGMGPASRFSLGGLPSQVAHHSPVDILVVRTARPRSAATPTAGFCSPPMARLPPIRPPATVMHWPGDRRRSHPDLCG